MQNERIFCFGRPIIDVTARIQEKFLREMSAQEISGKISTNKMKLLLELLNRRVDYILLSAGGAECNMAVNSAILGIPSGLAGTIGSDDFSPIFKYDLGLIKTLDLSLMSITTTTLNTAVVVVVWATNEDGEARKVKAFNYGASECLLWNTEMEAHLKEATIFFSSLFSANTSRTELMWRKAVETAKKLRKKIIISLGGIETIPMKRLEKLVGFISAYGDMVFANNIESAFLQKKYKRHIASILSGVEFLVITKGAEGCSIFNRDKEILIRIPSDKMPTIEDQIFEIGAGDAFCAGYIFAILDGATPEEAGNFATELSLIKLRCPKSHLAGVKLDGINTIIPVKIKRERCI